MLTMAANDGRHSQPVGSLDPLAPDIKLIKNNDLNNLFDMACSLHSIQSAAEWPRTIQLHGASST
jgi:hypothetical protein